MITLSRRNHRFASRSRPRHRASQYTTATAASSVPMPTIDWNARCVMLTGGQSERGTPSSPGTGASSELRAMIEPSRGMVSAQCTSPSISTPPRRSGAGPSVVWASSNAASFAGWVSWIRIPSTCPINGCATAATEANVNGTAKPSRWWVSTRPRSMPNAYTPDTTSPTSMNAATHMCANCSHTPLLNIARHGSMSTTSPFTIRKPAGLFIHALTETTQNVPTMPARPIGMSVSRCRRGGIRPHPYK